MNPELVNQVHLYREQYIQDGYVVISNFLETDYAESIWNSLNNAPPGFWKKTILIDDKLIGCRDDIDTDDENLSKLRNLAQFKAVEGEFSYSFSRNDYHDELCSCFGCITLRKVALSEKMLEFIRELTGQAITAAGRELFLSKYMEEDFLTLHTDYDKGKIAFVLNLTKNWQPYFGGLLHLLESNKIDVKKVVVPKFNQLTIFQIPQDGYPHFVSAVAPYVREKRYSMAGWFR